jgi:hypothetical protein
MSGKLKKRLVTIVARTSRRNLEDERVIATIDSFEKEMKMNREQASRAYNMKFQVVSLQ